MGIIIALISGALMSIQGVFNTKVTEQSSMWAVSYTHLAIACWDMDTRLGRSLSLAGR